MRPRPHTGDVRHHCQRCVLEAHSMYVFLKRTVCSCTGPYPLFYSKILLEISDLVAHTHYFLQIISCFAAATLRDKFSIYLIVDSVMVTVQTNHAGGRCYFEKDLWREFAACYVLQTGTKVSVDISQPGLIIHVLFPAQIRQ